MKPYDTRALVETEPDPIDWVIKDVAAKGALTILYGAPGIGKSYFMLACQGIITGRGDYLAGFELGHGASLLIDAENGEYELSRRLRALATFNGQCGIYFKAMTTDPGESIDDCYCQIQSEINRMQFPALVVLDSLRSLWPYGNEIDSKDVTIFLRGLQEIARRNEVAIVLLHHENRQGGYAGSRAMEAVPEIGVRISKNPNDKNKQRRRFSWTKYRVGPWPSEKYVEIMDNHGLGIQFVESYKPTKSELNGS